MEIIEPLHKPTPEQEVHTSNPYILVEVLNLEEVSEYYSLTRQDSDVQVTLQVGNWHATPENLRAFSEILKTIAGSLA